MKRKLDVFFACMFKEMYRIQEFAYFDSIYQLIRRCLKAQNKTASAPKIIYSVYYIFLSIIRIGHKHFVPEDELENKEMVVTELLTVIQKDTVFTTLMSQKYKFNVTRNNVANVLSSYFGLLFTTDTNRQTIMPKKIETFLTHFYYLLNIEGSVSKRTIDYLSDFINFYKELMIFKTCNTKGCKTNCRKPTNKRRQYTNERFTGTAFASTCKVKD